MVIAGSIEQRRRWTGVDVGRDGPTNVSDTLAPVLVDGSQQQGVYVEPNVWVRHRIG